MNSPHSIRVFKKLGVPVLAFFYLFSFYACEFGENVSYSSGQLNSNQGGVISKKFVWVDINSRPQMNRFTIQVSIPVNRLETVVSSFGISEDYFKFTYRNKFERQKKILELRKLAAEKGIRLGPLGNWMEMYPDYKWMISRSYQDVRPVFYKLYEMAEKSKYNDYYKVMGLYSSFVQNITYKVIPGYRINKNGKKIFICGVTMPLETLANGYGDCDTKSLLFASLIQHFRKVKVIFVEGENHVFVGVKAIPRPGEGYVRLGIDRYLLIELTSNWPLGEIPEKHWRGFQLKKFRVYRVV